MRKVNVQFQLALVTGASSGIGEALARLLASKSIPLILHGRNEEKLHALAAEFADRVSVTTIATPLERRESLLKTIREQAPDLVINNAGYTLYGNAGNHPTQDEMKILEVNGAAPLEITLEAAKALLRKKKSGIILNVSSILGDFPSPGTSIYGASKAFVKSFSINLDYELAPHGIRVLVSSPGQVVTALAARAAKKERVTRKGPLLSPEFAAQQIWWQIEKQKAVHIFDWRYRWGTWITTHLLPKWFVKKVIRKWIQSREI